jgi:predicted enzyme involved in methoxymalonyl-ACP biosynthesis
MVTTQMRLVDRFANNGLIAVVLGESRANCTLHLNTWLMSCRVLGRGVEQVTLNVIAAEAARRGLKRITGEYRATPSNGMTRGLYSRLSFREIPRVNGAQEGAEFWELPRNCRSNPSPKSQPTSPRSGPRRSPPIHEPL